MFYCLLEGFESLHSFVIYLNIGKRDSTHWSSISLSQIGYTDFTDIQALKGWHWYIWISIGLSNLLANANFQTLLCNQTTNPSLSAKICYNQITSWRSGYTFQLYTSSNRVPTPVVSIATVTYGISNLSYFHARNWCEKSTDTCRNPESTSFQRNRYHCCLYHPNT